MVAGDLVEHRLAAPVGRARRARCSWARRPSGRRAARSRTRRPASSCSRARSRRSRRGGPCGSSRSARGRGRDERLEAPFVGRDTELRLLKDLFHATSRERRVRLVSITGQARHRQEPPRLGVPEVRRRRRRADLVARGPVARRTARGSRSGRWARWSAPARDLLETDDPATTRTRIAEMLAQHVPDEDGAAADRARAARAARGGRGARRRAGRSCSPRGARSSSGSRRRASSRCCSRTSTGPTRGPSTSSSTCSSGAATSRS